MDKTALFSLSYGVYAATTKDGDRNVGCIVNSVFQVTSTPSTLALSINKNNHTNPCILKTGMFALSILSEKAENNTIATFGFTSSKDKDKFENVNFIVTENGMPVLTDGACAYLECKVLNTLDCMTHTVVFAEIVDAKKLSDDTPMTYAYYHKVVKGRAPKNAPTYIAPEELPKETPRYVCTICNYTYDGDEDFESLPDSYKCPVCGAPKSVFEKR